MNRHAEMLVCAFRAKPCSYFAHGRSPRHLCHCFQSASGVLNVLTGIAFFHCVVLICPLALSLSLLTASMTEFW